MGPVECEATRCPVSKRSVRMAILPRVVLLMGPTASGKTALGIEIAKALRVRSSV